VPFCGERSPTSLDNCKGETADALVGFAPKVFEKFGPAWRTVARKHRSKRAEVVTCLGAWARSLPPARVRKKTGARKGQHDASKYLVPGEVSLSPLNEKDTEISAPAGGSGLELPAYHERSYSAGSGEDSFDSWQHQNDHLYAGRAYLSRNRGKTKCSKRFTRCGTVTRRSMATTWIKSMQT
jgi:hypothetical protein